MKNMAHNSLATKGCMRCMTAAYSKYLSDPLETAAYLINGDVIDAYLSNVATCKANNNNNRVKAKPYLCS